MIIFTELYSSAYREVWQDYSSAEVQLQASLEWPKEKEGTYARNMERLQGLQEEARRCSIPAAHHYADAAAGDPGAQTSPGQHPAALRRLRRQPKEGRTNERKMN